MGASGMSALKAQGYIFKVIAQQLGLTVAKVESQFDGDEKTLSTIGDFLKGDEKVGKSCILTRLVHFFVVLACH